MKFRLAWRSKHTRKTGAGQWQAVRDGIEAWVERLNKSTDVVVYGIEYDHEDRMRDAGLFSLIPERDSL